MNATHAQAQASALAEARTALLNAPEDTLRDLYAEWVAGRTKSSIEREVFGIDRYHGKAITHAWRTRLGLETESTHPLVLENARLRALLEEAGISPDA
ncbi:MAG: hypothetical protein AB1679_14255 [Actinomycetota bacterium]|jgi:cobalamin biosynthesis protein CbiG